MATEKFFVFNEDGALKRLKGRIVRYLDNEDPTGSDKSAIRTSLEVSPDAAGLVQADVGTAPNEIPVNGMLGDMAYQSSDGVSAAKLQVESTTGTATTQALTVTDGTDTNFIVQEDGKVGVGGSPSTTNPLRVSSSDATTPQALIQSNTSTGDAALSFNVSGRTFSLGIDKSDSEKFKISRSSELGTTDYVTIDGGNVGIGTATPNAVTDITGSISGGRGLKITETSASKSNGIYTFEVDSSAHNSNVSAAGAMKIDVASGRAMTVDGLGRVGLQNDSPGSANGNANNLVIGNATDSTSTGISIVTQPNRVGSLFFANGTSGVSGYVGRVQYDHSTNALSFGVNGMVPWSINSVGNLVASGAYGIDFGSTNTNTGVTVTGSVMSEYEQGTFTPKLADAATGGNVATYSTNAGDYIRVGNQVFFALRLIDINTAGLPYPGNTIYITDMPYQCKSGSSFVPCNVMADSLTFTGQVTATLQGGVSYLILKEFSSGGADASLTVSAISSGVTDLFITGSYLVA